MGRFASTTTGPHNTVTQHEATQLPDVDVIIKSCRFVGSGYVFLESLTLLRFLSLEELSLDEEEREQEEDRVYDPVHDHDRVHDIVHGGALVHGTSSKYEFEPQT
jgi:hypothetical protein